MKEPRPYQKEIIEKAVDELSRKDRATVVMPCATGKTLVALWIIEQMEAKNVVVFVPTLGLLAQAAREFLANTQYQDVGCLAICSDANVVRGLDEIIPEPEELPFTVTEQVSVVQEYLKADDTPVKFLFCTYHSSDILGLALQRSGIALDFAFFDEAHRTAGRLEAPFTYALSNENLPVKKRLFMTATLRVYSFTNPSKADVYSMDNSGSYGQICAKMSFFEAVELGIICSYKVIVSVVDTNSLQMEMLYDGEVTGEEIPARDAAIRESILQALEKYDVRKIITYHTTIEQAENFASCVLNDSINGYEILHINSVMTGKLRHEVMKRFRNSERAIITNARCLTEGIDVPAVDMVVFTEPKYSEIDIVQAIGRAMRVSEGKATGYILLPLFLDQMSGESINEALLRGKYDTIWSVLNTLNSVDEEFESWMALYRQKWGIEGRQFVDPDLFEFLVPPGIDAQMIKESVSIFIVRHMSESWEERYGELLRFKREHGHINVPGLTPLNQWLSYQRRRWNTLTLEKQERLLELGFVSQLPDPWEKHYGELLCFKQEQGHIIVPFSTQLGRWLVSQRQHWNALTSEKQKRLLEIGFELEPHKERWMKKLEELKLFKEQHGHIKVSDKQNKQLKNWLKTQRRIWDTLPPERRTLLLELDFDPEPTCTLWQKRLEELEKYAEKRGHCNVRKNENNTLASYLKEMRQSYHEGRLANERIEALERLGMVWGDGSERLFEDFYHQLVAYRNEHGCLPTTNTRLRDTKILVGRMLIIRKAYRAGKLNEEQIRRLKETGFSFDPDEDRWQERYSELAEYVSKGRDPNRIPNKNRLHDWVRSVKQSYKNGRQSQEKTELLEKLGIAWDDTGYMNEKWQNYFQSVAEYFDKNGVNSLPATHPIYNWWKVQLKDINRLPPEKAEKIRSLRPIRLCHRWSEYEKTIIRENPDKTAEELSELLIGRTPQAIQKLRDKYRW